VYGMDGEYDMRIVETWRKLECCKRCWHYFSGKPLSRFKTKTSGQLLLRELYFLQDSIYAYLELGVRR
jgi:hypothetical protein